MKKTLFVLSALFLGFALAVVTAGSSSGKMELKAGDSVYACNCGEACPCQTLSNRAGSCHCGTELAKVTVEKVGDTTADLKFADGIRTFSRVGKYTCGCGESCTCQTISQSPGKCSCGTDLVEVEP